MTRLSAAELIDLVLDEGSWTSWDTAPDRTGVSPEYAAELAAAQEKSGCDESVLTGEGRFDETSLSGKVVGSLLDSAASAGVPVGVVAGQIAGPVPGSVVAAVSLVELAGSVDAALDDPTRWLAEAGAAMSRRLHHG